MAVRKKVRVAIIGVGNCASSLVQGLEYYRDADPDDRVPGLMHVKLGEYHVSDIEIVAAFDVDADALAAFATALFQRTRRANRSAGYGETRHLSLDAEHGRLFVVTTGDIALVLLTQPDASAGLLRVALQRALRTVA